MTAIPTEVPEPEHFQMSTPPPKPKSLDFHADGLSAVKVEAPTVAEHDEYDKASSSSSSNSSSRSSAPQESLEHSNDPSWWLPWGGEGTLDAVDLDNIRPDDPLPQREGLQELKPWTMDSGASDTVADPDDLPEAKVEPTEMSRAGRGWNGAGNEHIPSLGKLVAHTVLESGAQARTAAHATKVRRPLMAISGVAREGHGTWMDGEDRPSGIIPVDAPELKQIRELVKKCLKRVDIYQRGGVYKMRQWAPAGTRVKNSAVFARQGP